MARILITNRGEIASRIIKTARRLGHIAVALYSDDDAETPFVHEASEAYHLGPSPAAQSYLNVDKILKLAHTHKIDAIHPGYGFLSENPEFVKKVEDQGIAFIGPSAQSMTSMGDKLEAKKIAKTTGVPLIPGYDKAIKDSRKGLIEAKKIGFPVLIKAAAGGGGKGMRMVTKDTDFEMHFHRAASEAESSFGNSALFIEKYISKPRHIEIQIFGDHRGNYVYFNERECSIQRRHQKVIEESPSSIITPLLRTKMGEAAVMIARSCKYLGAGTVEFLVDENHDFYFLEMNTRLQVEHPVTELTTGTDLVAWQIQIAFGQPLPKKQNDISFSGHAIELRVYAEDAFNNFLPSLGTLRSYQMPEGKHIRVDNGVKEGQSISMHYDPLLAKLIVWGSNRSEALANMELAIKQYRISGIKTTLPFGLFVIKHPKFISGEFDTHFIEHYFDEEAQQNFRSDPAQIAALAAAKWHQNYLDKVLLPKGSIAWIKRNQLKR
jgi:acetyl-CoA carboxylase biotin carboxylase subunit